MWNKIMTAPTEKKHYFQFPILEKLNDKSLRLIKSDSERDDRLKKVKMCNRQLCINYIKI